MPTSASHPGRDVTRRASAAVVAAMVLSAMAAAPAAADQRDAAFTDTAGTTSTYHLFTDAAGSQPVGLVVYFDGDGQYGHKNPTSTWALGGRDGLVAQAAARRLATLSIRTPDRVGSETWWENGRVNAAYAADLIDKTRRDLGVDRVWVVGYSGGSQLITKWLTPLHGSTLGRGGAVITGGGGAPPVTASFPEGFPAGFPMTWHTGTADTSGYNAYADARRGADWYSQRGFTVTREWPAGVDHDDLGGQFGSIFAAAYDKAPNPTPTPTPTPTPPPPTPTGSPTATPTATPTTSPTSPQWPETAAWNAWCRAAPWAAFPVESCIAMRPRP